MKTLLFSLTLLVLLSIPQSGHTEKRAFSILDHYRIAKPEQPALSPQGDQLVYSVTRTDLHERKRWSNLWLMDVQSAQTRKLTHGKNINTHARFCPQGKTIAFLSDRDDHKSLQLYILPLEGGEARKLTDFPGGVEHPVWSFDCSHIAATAWVDPDCQADSACNRKLRKAKEKGRLKAYVTDTLLYRHWDDWRDGMYRHILLISVKDGRMVDLTPGKFDAPGFPDTRMDEYAFSPDGTELVFASNRSDNPAESTNSDLWSVSIADPARPSSPRRITQNPGWDGSPAYSPRGDAIAYRTQKTPGYESDRFQLAIYDKKTQTHRSITQAFAHWITQFAWTQPADRLVFAANEMGNNPLYQIEIKSGKIQRRLQHAAINSFAISSSANQVIFSSHAVNQPTELYLANTADASVRPITRLNHPLTQQVDLRPVEKTWVDNRKGTKIHTFIIKPHGFDPHKRYPLILMVHGGPQGMFGDEYWADFQIFPGLGYVVAYANPTGSAGYGQGLTDAIAEDWGGQVFDDLMRVTDTLEQLPFVDQKRMGAMGWSYGGYMMMWFEGHTDRFKALAAMMGVYDLDSFYGSTEELWFPEHDFGGPPWNKPRIYQKWSPSSYVKHFRTPCLVITGEQDFRVAYTQSLQFFTALQKRRVASRLMVLRNAGHVPDWYDMAAYYLLHADWFHRHLGGAKPPFDVDTFIKTQQLKPYPTNQEPKK